MRSTAYATNVGSNEQPVSTPSEPYLKALDIVFADYPSRPFRVEMWDGAVWESAGGEPANFTLIFHRPEGLRCFLNSGSEVALSEGYLFDDYDISGDLREAVAVAHFLKSKRFGWADKARLALLTRNLARISSSAHQTNHLRARLSGSPHSRRRDRQAIAHHYDVSNEFYRLWLDERMVYSCAYFQNPDDALDLAQQRKLEYICRKLDLKPGERLLDIGCGWGALLIHAAKEFGVEATGVTLSERQAKIAQERIEEEGLSDRCSVRLMDYRDLNPDPGFDKIASVGMFEHVGKRQFAPYFRKAWDLLSPGGLFLNHAITEPPAENALPGRGLISTYVFPDGELAPLSMAQTVAEDVGFEVRDVENLREHYARTLEHWVGRLERRQPEALQLVQEPVYRLWRLYMAGCAVGFHDGRIQVYQSLYRKAPESPERRPPFSRAKWYQPSNGWGQSQAS